MASTTPNAAPPLPPLGPGATGANATPRGGHRGPRGGRGGSRGGQTGSGPRKSRSERGGRRDGDRRSQPNRPRDGASNAPVDGATSHGRTSVVRVPSGSETATAVKPDADDAASDSDSAMCFICADPVIYSAIAPCNHVTCHICALRMRALYKNKACAHCRVRPSLSTSCKIAI